MDARDHRVFDAVRELLASQGMQLSMDAVAQHAGHAACANHSGALAATAIM